jgi:macrodomain Ter protein organizer (MatP/YcbG family)
MENSMEQLQLSYFNNRIIQDNKLIVIIEDKTYRVHMPIQSEQALVEHQCNLAHLKYLKEDGCISKEKLIKQIKEIGLFNIEESEAKRELLVKELKRYWNILATQSSDNKASIQECIDKLTKIEGELKQLAVEIAKHLAPALESRLDKVMVEYLTFLCSDVQEVDGKWIRVWNNFEDFQKADSSLVEKLAVEMMWLLLNKRS